MYEIIATGFIIIFQLLWMGLFLFAIWSDSTKIEKQIFIIFFSGLFIVTVGNIII